MMKKLQAVLAMAVVAGLAAAPAFGALTAWTEDFNSYTVNAAPPTPWSVNGNSEVKAGTYWEIPVAARKPVADQVLYTGYVANDEATRSIGSVASGTFEVTFEWLGDGSGTAGGRSVDFGIAIDDAGIWNDWQVHFRSYSSGNLDLHDGTNWQSLGSSYNDDAWHDFKLVVTPSASGGTFDAFIDSTQVADDWGFQNGSTLASERFGTALGGSGEYDRVFFDNITVAIPEPATLGLVGLFGGGILWIRRKHMA